MCQQNRMLVSDLNCLVLKELNKIKRNKKNMIEDMTVTATNIYIFQTLKLQSPGLVLTKNIQNSRVGH